MTCYGHIQQYYYQQETLALAKEKLGKREK